MDGDWLIAFGAILSGVGGFLVGLAALRMAQTGKKQREAPHEAPEHSDPGDDGGPGPSSS